MGGFSHPHIPICSGRRQGIHTFVAGDGKGSPLQIGYLGGRRGFASTKSDRIRCVGNLHGHPFFPCGDLRCRQPHMADLPSVAYTTTRYITTLLKTIVTIQGVLDANNINLIRRKHYLKLVD